MNHSRSLKVFADLRDLELFDSEGELCGIADDVEFDSASLKIVAILTGPGAYVRRLPQPLRWILRRLAGERLHRIPWSAVEHVTSRITLNRTATDLGLNAVEGRLRPLIQKVPLS